MSAKRNSNPVNSQNTSEKTKRVRKNTKENTIHFHAVQFTTESGYVFGRIGGKTILTFQYNPHNIMFSLVALKADSLANQMMNMITARETRIGSYFTGNDTLTLKNYKFLVAVQQIIDTYKVSKGEQVDLPFPAPEVKPADNGHVEFEHAVAGMQEA